MSSLASIAGIANLNAPSQIDSVPQLGNHSPEVAKAFEAIFASLLVKQLRNTGLGEGLFSGDKSDTLGGLFDMFLGQHLAQSEGLGVARMIQKYTDAAN